MIIGIDPGLDGAIAVLSPAGELIAIHDMPTLAGEGAKNRRSVNPILLADIIGKTEATQAFCELTGPRPSDGSVSAFGFGRSKGQIEGVCAALRLPIAFIAPNVWKRFSDIPAGKEHKDIARSRAVHRWPAQAAMFARKCDLDRAEACLIALAGMAKEGR